MAEKREFPIERTPDGHYRLRKLLCWDCGGYYMPPLADHLRSQEHRDWIKAHQTTIVPDADIPEEPTKPMEAAAPLVFGDTRVCPRCNGKLRPERKDRKGNLVPADTFTHDPEDKEGRCAKCKGVGVVQVDRVTG